MCFGVRKEKNTPGLRQRGGGGKIVPLSRLVAPREGRRPQIGWGDLNLNPAPKRGRRKRKGKCGQENQKRGEGKELNFLLTVARRGKNFKTGDCRLSGDRAFISAVEREEKHNGEKRKGRGKRSGVDFFRSASPERTSAVEID